MSYLAAIGRAQPVQAIQTFQANKQNAALQDKNMAVQDLKIKQVTQDMEIKQQEQEYKEQQRLQEEQTRLAPVHVPSSPMFLAMPQSVQETILKDLSEKGITNEQGVGPAGPISDWVNSMATTHEGLNKYLKPVVEIKQAQLNNLIVQKLEMQNSTSPNPKKLEELDTQIANLAEEWGRSEVALSEAFKNAKDSRTTDIKEFEYGQENPEFQEWQDRGGGGKPKDMQSYMLPDQSFVNSFDGGMTYTMPGGERVQMPQGSIKVSATLTGTELQALKAQAMARDESGGVIPTPAKTPEEMDRAAESATGIGANLRALVDNVLGGVGIAAMVGKDGFFQDTQENRQTLNLIKQMGKMALMNSSRGPVYEQQIIENLFPNPGRFFVNPKTEAKKFQTIRSIMVQEKMFNNMAMQNMTDPAAIQRLVENNKEIDSLLYHLGGTDARPGDEIIQVFGDTIEDQLAMAESLPEGTVFIDGNGVKRVKQGGAQ